MVPPVAAETCVTMGSASICTTNTFLQLSPEEICVAANSTRKHFGIQGEELRFSSISLLDPVHAPKSFEERLAHVVVQQPQLAESHELHISLHRKTVLWKQCLGRAQPPLSPDDCTLAEKIVKEDAGVLAKLLERHGIDDAAKFRADPWSVHITHKIPELCWRSDAKPARLVQTFLYAVEDMRDNQYAHPIDIVPVVDLNARRVIKVMGNNWGPISVSKVAANYHRDVLCENNFLPKTFRENPPKPLHLVQPLGPSFEVEGNFVSWQRWSFAVGFNYREGLVLHDVKFGGRSILARAALVEMAVPYLDPVYPYVQKCAFDVGDYGLGYCATSLSLGCDCLGAIHYFDAVLANSKGEPYTVKKAVCMHEEDSGLAWKHVDYITMHNESRRARRLVLSFIATVVNYECK